MTDKEIDYPHRREGRKQSGLLCSSSEEPSEDDAIRARKDKYQKTPESRLGNLGGMFMSVVLGPTASLKMSGTSTTNSSPHIGMLVLSTTTRPLTRNTLELQDHAAAPPSEYSAKRTGRLA